MSYSGRVCVIVVLDTRSEVNEWFRSMPEVSV